MVPASVTHFIPEEHLADWSIFTDCINCYLFVKSDSKAYDYCERFQIPHKIW